MTTEYKIYNGNGNSKYTIDWLNTRHTVAMGIVLFQSPPQTKGHHPGSDALVYLSLAAMDKLIKGAQYFAWLMQSGCGSSLYIVSEWIRDISDMYRKEEVIPWPESKPNFRFYLRCQIFYHYVAAEQNFGPSQTLEGCIMNLNLPLYDKSLKLK